jgi:hypothetical protein
MTKTTNQAPTRRIPMTPTVNDLVLCRSDTGDGGWSLHPPGSTDEQIASGDAPYLLSGDSKKNKFGRWSRPNAKDYRMALKGLDG